MKIETLVTVVTKKGKQTEELPPGVYDKELDNDIKEALLKTSKAKHVVGQGKAKSAKEAPAKEE